MVKGSAPRRCGCLPGTWQGCFYLVPDNCTLSLGHAKQNVDAAPPGDARRRRPHSQTEIRCLAPFVHALEHFMGRQTRWNIDPARGPADSIQFLRIELLLLGLVVKQSIAWQQQHTFGPRRPQSKVELRGMPEYRSEAGRPRKRSERYSRHTYTTSWCCITYLVAQKCSTASSKAPQPAATCH